MTREQLQHILAALIRMEHKTTDSMNHDEYWAAVTLAIELEAPQFITEYFAAKALATQE